MLKVTITPRAMNVIDAVADYVESQNTSGSGARFAIRFKNKIESLAIPNVIYALCSHSVLAGYQYSCSYFNDWVIVFRINPDELTIYDIIHSSLLF